MQILPFIVAFLLFLAHTDALRSDSSMSEYFGDRRKDLSKMKGLIFHQSQKTPQNEVPVLDSPQDFFCQQCLDVSSKARRILSDSSLVAEVSMLISEACLLTFSDLGAECLQMAEELVAQAVPYLQILFLEEEEDVCTSTGFCPTNTRTPSHPSVSPREPTSPMLRKTSPASCKSFDGVDNNLTLDKVLSELGETRICAACRVILFRIRTTLRNPMTQALIIKLLLRACTMTNRKYIHKCKKLVTEYGPVSVTLLTKFVNVVDLCNITHSCQLVEPKQGEAYDRYTN